AVGHQRQPLDPGFTAGGSGRVVQYRADPRLGEDALDLPYDLLSLYRVGLHRLPVHQLVELGAAVAAIVPHRAAYVILVEHLVGIVDTTLYRNRADRIVLARHLGIPERGVDEVELGIDVDFLEVRDHDHRKVPPSGKVARRYLDGEVLVRPKAELLHDLAR